MITDDLGFDTGFVPASSPVSLRIALSLNSRTDVQMTALARATWPDPLTVNLTGTPTMGTLSMDFGLVFAVQLRLAIDTPLGDIDRTFDIPTGLPSDLAFIASQDFDPLLLPGAPGRPVSVTDTTERLRVASFDVPVITGLTVGGALDLRGRLTTDYQTDSVLIDAVSITSESESVLWDAPGGTEFGAAADIPTTPAGTFNYDADLELLPVLTVKFFSFELASFTLGEFAVQAFATTGPASFATEAPHIPLPNVRFLATEFAFPDTEVGQSSELLVTIRNFGEDTLHVDLGALPAPFSAAETTHVIEPDSFARTRIIFTPTEAGAVSLEGFAETNDPDSPRVSLALSGNGTVQDADMGVGNDGGMDPGDGGPMILVDGSVMGDAGDAVGGLAGGACGCRVPGRVRDAEQGAPLAFALGLLALVGFRQRRRRRTRR